MDLEIQWNKITGGVPVAVDASSFQIARVADRKPAFMNFKELKQIPR